MSGQLLPMVKRGKYRCAMCLKWKTVDELTTDPTGGGKIDICLLCECSVNLLHAVMDAE